MDLPCYHGPLSKQDCESLLLKEGVDGNFLLRDSESVPGVLCLCVSFKKFVYTYRIFKEKHGYYNIQTAEGAKKQTFSSLKELISQYEKPNQGLVVNLLKPVKRTSPCLGWRTSKLDLDKTYEDKNDYVNSSSCVNSNTVYGKSGSVLGESSSVYANSDSVLGKSGSVYANSDRVLGDSGSVYANSDSEDVYSSKDYVDVLP